MRKKKTQAEQQEQKFPVVRYGWKSVRDLKKHDLVVVGQEEVRVVTIKHEGGEWMIGYDGEPPNSRSEQLYHDHDSVYTRVEVNKVR